jgi:hypothetical protein
MPCERRDEIDPVLHPVGGRARANRPRAIGIDGERELLLGGVVLVGVEHELVVRVRVVIAAAHEAQVPPREHTRRRVHVLLAVVADAEREQLHDLAPEVLLRTLARVRAPVEPDQHRRVLGNLDQQIAEAAEGELAEQFDLALWTRQFAGLQGHHLRTLHPAHRTRQLAVRGGEVVVPEQRHLLLQRALRVHHAEQPALPCVLDVRVRRERAAARRHADVCGLADLRVHVIRLPVVIHQEIDRGR